MTDHLHLLQYYLGCYGSDIHAWPEDARAWLKQAQAETHAGDAVFGGAIAAEKQFEYALLSREFTAASRGLAERIIKASKATPIVPYVPEYTIASYMTPFFRPSVLATILALGFALGFNSFHYSANEAMVYSRSYSDDEGTAL